MDTLSIFIKAQHWGDIMGEMVKVCSANRFK